MPRDREYYWRKKSFEALEQVASRLENGPHVALFAGYIDYLTLRAAGRRKEALAAARVFVATFADDDFEIRKRICWHLIETTESYWDRWPHVDNWLLPGNMTLKFVVPTWEEWRGREPRNADLWIYDFGWQSGIVTEIERAFLLQPHKPVYQYLFLRKLLPYIEGCFEDFVEKGLIYGEPQELEESVVDLDAVCSAMGGNLNFEYKPLLVWLREAIRQRKLQTRFDADLRFVLPMSSDFSMDLLHTSFESWFLDPSGTRKV